MSTGPHCARTLLILILAAIAQASPMFVNGIAISGGLNDKFGTGANSGRVGFFSDLSYDPIRNQWWGLSDRGPGGGSLLYDTRIQQFTLDVDLNTGAISNFQIVNTVKFTDGAATMNGLAPNPTNLLGNAFDPEGVVIHPTTGNFLISDEYGPSLYEFNRNGQLVRKFETPGNLTPRNTSTGTPNFAGDTGNNAGKRTNRGFEGLAITPDGKFTFAVLQSAALDEGGATGTVTRIVKFDNTTGKAVAQYAYQMDTAAQGRGVSGLVALNDNEFLILERNNRGIGTGADIASPDKRVYKISLAGATDVSNIDLDAPGAVYNKVTKASSVFLDLDADTLAALGFKSPEKWEGLAIGPRLNDGSYLMLAGTDNDYSVTQNTAGSQFDVYFRFSDTDPYATSIQCPLGTVSGCFRTDTGVPTTLTPDYALLPGVLHAYKTPAADLAGYISPASIPEPSTWLMLSVGAVALLRRRKR